MSSRGFVLMIAAVSGVSGLLVATPMGALSMNLLTRLKVLSADLSEMTEIAEHATKVADGLKSKVEGLESENTGLRQDLESEKARADEATKSLSEREESYVQLEKEKHALEVDHERLSEDYSSLWTSFLMVKSDNTELQAELAEFTKEVLTGWQTAFDTEHERALRAEYELFSLRTSEIACSRSLVRKRCEDRVESCVEHHVKQAFLDADGNVLVHERGELENGDSMLPVQRALVDFPDHQLKDSNTPADDFLVVTVDRDALSACLQGVE